MGVGEREREMGVGEREIDERGKLGEQSSAQSKSCNLAPQFLLSLFGWEILIYLYFPHKLS